MIKARASRGRRADSGRDDHGRFKPGFTGNPYGRPPKVPEVPKLLGEQLADKLWEKVPRTGADGKMRTISAYELIIERFIEALPTAKPKEIMSMLEWMQKLSVFDSMRAKVTDPSENWFEDEYRERMKTRSMISALNRP